MAVNNKFYNGPFLIDPAYVNNAITALQAWGVHRGSLPTEYTQAITTLQSIPATNPTTANIATIRTAAMGLDAWYATDGIDNRSLQTRNEIKYLVDNYTMTILIGGTGNAAYVLYQQE